MRNYNGVPHLAIGRTFFSVNTSESLLKDMPDTPYDIEFDENVAEDNLSIHKLDPALMALEAIAMYPDNSMFKATIRRDPKDTSKFQVINETKISKNQLKNTLLSEYDKTTTLRTNMAARTLKSIFLLITFVLFMNITSTVTLLSRMQKRNSGRYPRPESMEILRSSVILDYKPDARYD